VLLQEVARQRFLSRLHRSLERRRLVRLGVPRQEPRRFRFPDSLFLLRAVQLVVVPLREGEERLRSLVRSRRRARRVGCRSLRLRVVVRFRLSPLRRVGFQVTSGNEG
jgi:hypothetical protein